MANLYTKEVIVGMIYVVHVVKRNKNPFSCDSVVSLKSKWFPPPPPTHVDTISRFAYVWFMPSTRRAVFAYFGPHVFTYIIQSKHK